MGKNRQGTSGSASLFFLTAFLLCFFLSLRVMASENTGTQEPQEEKTLTITVVESIPAEDIEEAQVPLAAFSNTPAKEGVRHAALFGLLAAAVVLYGIYIAVTERRLAGLRKEAALAAQKWMDLQGGQKK